VAEIKYKDTNNYYWCAWGGDIVHFGKLESGQRVTSGQPNIESYETEAELEAKVDSLKSEDYYKEHTMTAEEFAEYLDNKE
tara:strand:+ start:375 stop:617 length:243 start_codon:yes stop_codon:yes gene_type:complete